MPGRGSGVIGCGERDEMADLESCSIGREFVRFHFVVTSARQMKNYACIRAYYIGTRRK